MNAPLTKHTCKSCGNKFEGTYCNVCGEKVLEPADASFRTFLNSLLQSLTFTDGKIFRTLWTILSNPGFVSSEFVIGRRIYFLRPLSLFFALNLIYFLFPVIQLFNASLKTQVNSPLQPMIKEMVAHKMIQEGVLSIDSFSLLYDQKTANLAKLIVMLFVIMASLPLNLLYRKRGFFFMSNVTFVTELVCFNLFLNAIVLTIVLRLTGIGHFIGEGALTGLFVVTNVYFLLRSGSTFYRERGWKLLAKSAVMLVVLRLSLEAYRIILFFLTMASL